MDLRGSRAIARSSERRVGLLVAVAIAAALANFTSSLADEPRATVAPEVSTNSVTAAHEVELRGRMVRLPSLPSAHPKGNDPHPEQSWAFRTADGTVYHLLRNRFSEAVLTDPRVRKQDLLLKGVVHSDTRQFEVERTFSIRNGTVYDVYYYCSVCHIETVSPGRCECCQGPVELKEKPLRPDKP